MSKKVIRLFEQFQPDNYQLELTIDPEAMSFSGQVTITGKKVGRPSQRLTFHQKELKIIAATITKLDKNGPKEIVVERINNQASYDEVRLHTTEKLFPGAYSVTMKFTGKITKPMNGIYPCFFEQDGQEQKLIATQFESHHAREAFPCIDEPEAKATFVLTLNTPQSKAILANTPIKLQETVGERIVTTFEETPRMSTYLLAFVLGDMDYLEAQTKDGVAVRTYATPENVKHTQFALDVAVKCLEFYNDYFDIPYPLAKCDFIALPDFASGAMENWCCITFREQALLVDPANTSLPMKQWVANVVAHELTHQWFGNLVTMKWWNDLWLNESFASWMSYLAIDQLFPEWKVWEQFIVDEQSQALKLDALDNTHPIEVTINHPDEIRTIFDAISYEKGASVILMLKEYLGEDAFREGLRIYLKRHAYGNTASTDLWAAWEEASAKPVQEFMGTWTSQPGYPIVKVSVTDTTESFEQERFYLNPQADKQPATWPVPLAPDDGLTITKGSTNITLDEPLGESIPIFNQDHMSFCRVIYQPAQLKKLAANINKLPVLDRLGILADSFEASKAGYTSTVDTLQLLQAYENEDNTFVWDVLTGVLAGIRSTMRDEDLREAMKPLGRKLAATQVTRLGWEEKPEESHFDTLLRPTVLGLAAASDDEAVVAEALKRFAAMEKPEDVAPDIRGIVYGTAARKGADKEFDKLLAMHNASKNSEDRVTLSAALTSFEQPELYQKALAQVTTKDVRLQDAGYWVAYSFANRFARDTTWQWMKDNWQWLLDNMGNDLSFYRMPNYAARNYSDESFLPEFKQFFEAHMNAAFERPVKQGVETIQWQAAWRTRDLAAIQKFFTK
jgi:puromycin-sensitive aminopeptidase